MAVDHIAESSRRNAASASNDEGAPKSGRVVFLAQPARDMEQAYMRLATEFRGRGYGVAPDPRSGIFNGRAAEQFVDQALNGAEFSVHLIGAEETPDRIVAMQLARARDRAGAAKAAGATMLFRRMIWAPRIFQAGGAVVERDPLHVLDRFDQQIATDKIEGGIIGNFIEYLFQYLAEAAPLPTARKRAPPRVVGEREEQSPPPASRLPAKSVESARDERPATRYYVSYARADASDPNREKDVDALCTEAERRGVKVFRDKVDLQPGEQISTFMRELGEADRVFIFLSNKYLTSLYCMNELFEMWRNSRENEADFLRHVRVFTLDGTHIEQAGDQLKYVEYWTEQRDNLAQQINKVGWMKAGDPIRNKAILMDKIANEVSGLIGLIADTVQARTFDEFLKIGLADGPGA
ncbi:MAG: toll/interleukin-1 receptor domain-containing protein [Roseiarcus sp.]|uniref:toll/interleukin-1 receptor domain-containing protein n=1 Tax=Roseiarcus sp. TaxID=1969460 RepID=UPI003C5ED3F5